MNGTCRPGLCGLACLLLAVTGAWAADGALAVPLDDPHPARQPDRVGEAPVAVSPGDPDHSRPVGANCPAFSWGATAGALTYELAVYRLDDENLVGAQPVLRATVPGTALSWTPSLDQALGDGGAYAWAVRALLAKGATDWSRPSLFRVAPRTTEAEFREALLLVEEYLEAPGRLAQGVPSAGSIGRRTTTKRSAESPFRFSESVRSELGATVEVSAITAEMPKSPGVTTYGVLGATNSSEENSAGVLEGE